MLFEQHIILKDFLSVKCYNYLNRCLVAGFEIVGQAISKVPMLLTRDDWNNNSRNSSITC